MGWWGVRMSAVFEFWAVCGGGVLYGRLGMSACRGLCRKGWGQKFEFEGLEVGE